MRRFFIALTTTLVVSLALSLVVYAATVTASANQHPIGGSGIQGRIHFTDNGASLTVDGTATGLTPNVPYFTLIYTNGSTPGGISEAKAGAMPATSQAITPCESNRSGVSTVTEAQMVVGFWTNHNDGTGTLHKVQTGASYAPIGTFATVSIRDASAQFALVACGEVHAD